MSLGSHDTSLKYLLAQDPADFIAFGLGGASLQVLRPMESDLAARDRDVDGGYLVQQDQRRAIIHVEFYRRHESLRDVALDLGEAQVRIARRERVAVYSHLWDLYGSRKDPVREDRIVPIGQPDDPAGTRICYRRINLRGMGAAELLQQGPRTFYPLVPLTRDGADIAVVEQAAAAIEARLDLSPGQRADHLVVLRFLAEAEDVPVQVLQSHISEKQMMESSFYRSIIAKGEARGEARGEAKGEARGKAEALIRILVARLGRLDPAVKQAIQAQADPDVLSLWLDEAILALDAEAARRLVQKISTP